MNSHPLSIRDKLSLLSAFTNGVFLTPMLFNSSKEKLQLHRELLDQSDNFTCLLEARNAGKLLRASSAFLSKENQHRENFDSSNSTDLMIEIIHAAFILETQTNFKRYKYRLSGPSQNFFIDIFNNAENIPHGSTVITIPQREIIMRGLGYHPRVPTPLEKRSCVVLLEKILKLPNNKEQELTIENKIEEINKPKVKKEHKLEVIIEPKTQPKTEDEILTEEDLTGEAKEYFNRHYFPEPSPEELEAMTKEWRADLMVPF